MGCVSSSLLNQEEELSHMGSTVLGHHIVSLTSTTYGLLTLDPPQLHPHTQTPTSAAAPATTTTSSTSRPPAPPFASLFPSPLSESRAIRWEPEIINSWELMAGLDTNDSFRFSPLPLSQSSRPGTPKFFSVPRSNPSFKPRDRENWDPNVCRPFPRLGWQGLIKPGDSSETGVRSPESTKPNYSLDGFVKVCPPVPNGENKVVLYTTSLRGVRSTFEACNAVRSALQALGFSFCEKDISMDRSFREELNLLRPQIEEEHSSASSWAPPRLFIKGRYVGGAEDVLRIHENGGLADLLQGFPKFKPGLLCDGCGGFSFLPCFRCHGSCKLVMLVNPHDFPTKTHMHMNKITRRQQQSTSATTDAVVVRCPDCNENGLILCPICS